MQRRQPSQHGAWCVEEAISVQREDIMWLMYFSALHGWCCTWLEKRDSMKEEGGTQRSWELFPFFAGYSLNRKLHPRSHQSKFLPIHWNYTWMRVKAVASLERKRKKNWTGFSFLSSFISLCWYLHVNDFCVSAFLLFVRYLHVIAFRCLMVLQWNESNLLSDSQAILPAITLIHFGQWAIMTVKPRSCEDILQALALVMLVRLL